MEALLLRPSQAADVLGIGRSMAYELIKAGELPAVRIGNSLRIARADLEAYVARLQQERDQAMPRTTFS